MNIPGLSSSKDNSSTWDAFFKMEKILTESSDDDDDNDDSSQSSAYSYWSDGGGSIRSARSERSMRSERSEMTQRSASSLLSNMSRNWNNRNYTDESDDGTDYDSEVENKANLKSSRRFRRKNEKIESKKKKGDKGDENDEKEKEDGDVSANLDVFSSYLNNLNRDTNNRREFTLIPIGGAAQAQYMILTPKGGAGDDNPSLLSPQSIRSVSLKQGLSNNTSSTTKKIFKLRTKKAPEKKPFMKVHPKKLEQKYDNFKSKRNRSDKSHIEESVSQNSNVFCKSNSSVAESDDDNSESVASAQQSHFDRIPMLSNVSRLLASAVGNDDKHEEESEDDEEEEIDEVEEEEDEEDDNPSVAVEKKKRDYFPFGRSRSRSREPNARGKGNMISENLSHVEAIEQTLEETVVPTMKEAITETVQKKEEKRGFWGRSSSSANKEVVKSKSCLSETKNSSLEDQNNGCGIVEMVEGNIKNKKPRKGFRFKKLFKKVKGKPVKGGDDSIETDPSQSSMKPTQLGPNKVLSMVRTQIPKSDFSSLDEYDEIQNEMVEFSYFGGDPKKSMVYLKKKEQLIPAEDSEEVLVQVEASTVSKTDCYIRHGRLWTTSSKNVLPITPGVDFVGHVVKCGQKAKSLYGININDRVSALVQTGGNSKYILEHANQLVKVPKSLSAEHACCMVEVYLSALQILLYGVDGQDRYNSRPLEGKQVLIIGGITTINQAAIELATFFGAKNVYTTAVEKHDEFLEELGATVLDISFEHWLPKVKGRMDIVVDSYCDDHYESPFQALNPTGKLICHGMQTIMNESPGCITSLEQLWARTKSACMPRTHNYDVYSHWENNLVQSKEDLSFLYKLLEKNAINPSVADTVSLRKVQKAHVFLEAPRRIQGSFVCLPHSEG